jgi:putative copper resistance protein D
VLDAALACVRFAASLGGALTVGFRLFAGPGRGRTAKVGAVLILLAALALLPLEAAALGAGPAAAADPATLRAVLLETPLGISVLLRAALGATALALLVRGGRAARLAAPAALLALAAGALAGHAAAGEGAFGTVRLLVGAGHAVAAGLWTGALLAFAAALAAPDEALLGRLRRFALPGAVLVLVLVLTGVFNLAADTGALFAAPLLTAPWGRLLLCKLAAVAAMGALAVRNRSLLAGRDAGPYGPLAASVRLEAGLGVLVLALVGVLGLLPPA